ncbi:hypothetical protein PRUPE_8G144400 [Prunus persica]|uniref:Interferon-related developmental regulator N-terminal domain-containing protein n=1 Tax=Prunus persica TaxID=3760 RepID=A0A251MXV4_PRUPE|nr:uncharacterized protein LOC18767809 [Prunus persica]ONH91931.1 hypothetical protein PRUPE_8G144400 [Prunus persica]
MSRRDKARPSSSRKRSQKSNDILLRRWAGRKPVLAAGDDEGYEEVPRPSQPKRLCHYLEVLYEKRGSNREEALASIIEVLTCRLENDYLEENFASFLYRGLNSLKIGSSKEKQLSLHVIGLLAIIICCEDKLSEVYRVLLPVLSESLKSGTTTLKMLNCLAIVGFFGSTNSEETEGAMQIIWKFIHPESVNDVNTKKHSPEVLVAAIYSWLFLLTSMEGWRLSHNSWNGAVCYFSNLLEHGDKLVRVAACEALALIFETGNLDKFWKEAKDHGSYSHMQQSLRENVLKKLKCLYVDTRSENIPRSENITKKVCEVVNYFESFQCLGTSLTINGKDLKLSSWYQMIQLQFLKNFLNDGFKIHMKGNEKLQHLFEFNPRRIKNLGPELYVSTTDKITVRFFLPEERNAETLTKENKKKERVWRNSLLEKARTQLMSKHRRMSEEMNCCDYD